MLYQYIDLFIALIALGNGLFSTLLLYQRIVNLMAAVEGIGCHQVIYIWNIKPELDHDLLDQIKFQLQAMSWVGSMAS